MAWFPHRHVWRELTGLSVIKNGNGGNSGALFLEDCSCGAIRQVEYAAGVPPVIRITHAPTET